MKATLNATQIRNPAEFRSFFKVIGAGVVGLGVAAVVLKVATATSCPPAADPVAAGMTRIGVAGYPFSPPTAKAHELAHLIATKYPKEYDTYYYWDMFAYYAFLKEKFDPVPFPSHLKGHATSPFAWLERDGGKQIAPIGGSDDMSKWALETFPDAADIVAKAKEAPSIANGFHVESSKMTAKLTKFWGEHTKL